MTGDLPAVVFVGEAMVELRSTAPHTVAWTFAGDTFNAAAAFAHETPATPVRYLTGVGEDDLSDRLLARCRELGVDTSGTVRLTDRTLGLYWIEAVDGDQRFRYWRDSSAARHALSTGLLLSEIGRASHVVWSGITLAVAGEGAPEVFRALRDTRNKGTTICFDLNHRPSLWPDAEAARHTQELALATADIVTASSDDIAALWAEHPRTFAERALDAGTREVVVTNGSGALTCTSPDGIVTYRPTPATVVDSAGAGDAFWGTYLARRVAGDAVSSALEHAADTAANAVEHSGALGYLM